MQKWRSHDQEGSRNQSPGAPPADKTQQRHRYQRQECFAERQPQCRQAQGLAAVRGKAATHGDHCGLAQQALTGDAHQQEPCAQDPRSGCRRNQGRGYTCDHANHHGEGWCSNTIHQRAKPDQRQSADQGCPTIQPAELCLADRQGRRHGAIEQGDKERLAEVAKQHRRHSESEQTGKATQQRQVSGFWSRHHWRGARPHGNPEFTGSVLRKQLISNPPRRRNQAQTVNRSGP